MLLSEILYKGNIQFTYRIYSLVLASLLCFIPLSIYCFFFNGSVWLLASLLPLTAILYADISICQRKSQALITNENEMHITIFYFFSIIKVITKFKVDGVVQEIRAMPNCDTFSFNQLDSDLNCRIKFKKAESV